MNRLFVGNFDFEHRLAAPSASGVSGPLRRINDELASSWAAVAEDGDFILSPPEIEHDFYELLSHAGLAKLRPVQTVDEIKQESVELCPWGWTHDVRRLAMEYGCHIGAPQQEIVRNSNSRRLSFQYEQSWNVGLAQSAMVATLGELRNAVAALPAESPWVVKAEFGMSARERVLGRGNVIDEPTANWAAKRFARDGVLFVEPWVEKLEEAGLQFDIGESGPALLCGITPLTSDAGGHYRGSRFEADATSESRWSTAIETGMRLCERLQQQGYFGPVGIDAMRYIDRDGNERLRPLQDVNARWTMGRLALGFRRLLNPGETGEWRHAPWPTDSPTAPQDAHEAFVATLLAGVRTVRTAPYVIGGRPVRHGSVVVIREGE